MYIRISNLVLILLALFAFNGTSLSAQSYILKGTVVDRDSTFALPNSHVVNNRTFMGTVSNGIGYFEIPVAQGDTLVLSNIGYQFKYVSIDSALCAALAAGEEQVLKLIPRNYLLDEVSIYAITSNNPRTMPQRSPRVPASSPLAKPACQTVQAGSQR